MTSFDLDTLLQQPRLGGLALSPGGDRAAVGVATPAPDGQRLRTSLWTLDPAGQEPSRQLTVSRAGESNAAYLPDGTLLFTSERPDPGAPDDAAPTALWALPADGGEARLVCSPGGGVSQVLVAADSATVLVATELHPGATSLQEDRDRQEARDDAGVTAQLFDAYPISRWDHYLGPREPAWLVLDPAALELADAPPSAPRPVTELDDERLRIVARGPRLRDGGAALSRDGRTLVLSRQRHHRLHRTGPADMLHDLVVVDVATGQQRTLAATERSLEQPALSPDGRTVACVAEEVGAPDRPATLRLALVDVDRGEVTDVATDLDLWPSEPCWSPDGAAVLFSADEDGRRPLFRLDVADGRVTRLTRDHAFAELAVADDGTALAMRATPVHVPRPVRLDLDVSDQAGQVLPSPAGDDPDVTVERLETTAEDGTPVRSWLVTPTDGDGPRPLVTFIHGGPLMSWNSWTWRWCPAVFADAGYAVLLPDPALSTGYGQAFVDRGWARWGAEPYTDLLAAVEHAAARDDVDGDRLAATGGSFGGYMANWVAGHTDRFRCIVTHASLWSLEPFHGTTDLGVVWEAQFGDPYLDASRYREHSPAAHVAEIRTPMLVIHGEQDLRVPISEALTLWTDLARHGVEARFLYFPDENHWILKPQNARLWYRTFLAFLGEHLRDEPFERPELL